jgi:hypothetical protein
MRYKEFALESYELDEEISLTKLQPAIYEAMMAGLTSSINITNGDYLSDERMLDWAKIDYNNGNTAVLDKFIKRYFFAFAMMEMGKLLEKEGKKIVPELESVSFDKMDAGAYVRGFKIVMSETTLNQITDLLYNNIQEEVMSKYELGNYLTGFLAVVDNAIKTNCKDLDKKGQLFYSVMKYSETFIHELVHIVQHERQKHRGGEFEFRSYLDKEKDEFLKLARKRNMASPSDDESPRLSGDEQSRYNDLYYASPAEIAAHAHNIALKIISSHGLGSAGYSKRDYVFQAKQALKGITGSVDSYLKKRYKGQTDPKMQDVYKRYHKLVYQEVYKRIQDTLKTANFKA